MLQATITQPLPLGPAKRDATDLLDQKVAPSNIGNLCAAFITELMASIRSFSAFNQIAISVHDLSITQRLIQRQ